jgi:NADH-quinone oxidoreductase subunit G
VLLPIAPFTETAGSFVNAEGRLQTFTGVAPPLGETRPAWKVLRVLGNLLELDGFEQDNAEQVRTEAIGDAAAIAARLDNRTETALAPIEHAAAAWQRIADVPIYATDALVRRAPSLQRTADARAPVASLPSAVGSELGLRHGEPVRIEQGAHTLIIAAVEDAGLADGVVRVPAGHADTLALGPMFGPINVDAGLRNRHARYRQPVRRIADGPTLWPWCGA